MSVIKDVYFHLSPLSLPVHNVNCNSKMLLKLFFSVNTIFGLLCVFKISRLLLLSLCLAPVLAQQLCPYHFVLWIILLILYAYHKILCCVINCFNYLLQKPLNYPTFLKSPFWYRQLSFHRLFQ